MDAECNGYSGYTDINVSFYENNVLVDDWDGTTSGHGGTYIDSTENYAHICLRGSQAVRYYEGIYTAGLNSSILCNGFLACNDVVSITTVYGSIFCTSQQSCRYNTMSAGYNNDGVENVIYCGGYLVCYQTTILNADKLYCTGSQASCGLSRILNVKNVYILAGVHATIQNTVIMSNVIDGVGGQMNVYIYSDLAADWWTNAIYCNASDTCFIDCGSNGACANPDSCM